MFLRRPGGQAQFSAQLAVQFAEHEPLRDLQAYIFDRPREDLSVETLARRAAMSPRNFARVFTAAAIGSSSARTTQWKFTGQDGKPWTGTVTLQVNAAEGHQYRGKLTIARAGQGSRPPASAR